MNKTKNLNIDWKLFYKSVFALVIPMALQNLINVGVTATDVIMLGKVGEKVLSGASLAGQVQFIMTLIFYGTTSGATVLTAQYWGKKDTRTIEKILGIGLRTGLTTAVVFAVAALGIPGLLMRIYTSDPVVIAEGVKYLRIVALSYIFMAVTQVYLNIIRSMEKVVIATFIYAVSLGLNIIINAVLIFGMFGFPKLGIAGAAIGTLCARGAETIMVLFYAFLKNKIVRIRLQDMLHIDPVLWKDFLVYALPVVLNELMWGLGSSANTAVAGSYLSFMFFVMSYFTVAQAFNTTMVIGIFRSGGDTKFGMIMDVSTMWGCSILLGAAAAFIFHAGVPVVYMILMSDELIKIPITIKRYLSFKWLKDVTREREELEGEAV